MTIAPGLHVDDDVKTEVFGPLPKYEEAYDNLGVRLQYLKDNYSTPFTTRVVRNEAGFMNTKDDGTAVHLQPSILVREEWYQWVYRRGWIQKEKCKNSHILDNNHTWEE